MRDGELDRMKLSLFVIVEILGLLKHEPYQLLTRLLVLENANEVDAMPHY